jgi:hypothetical protein
MIVSSNWLARKRPTALPGAQGQLDLAETALEYGKRDIAKTKNDERPFPWAEVSKTVNIRL